MHSPDASYYIRQYYCLRCCWYQSTINPRCKEYNKEQYAPSTPGYWLHCMTYPVLCSKQRKERTEEGQEESKRLRHMTAWSIPASSEEANDFYDTGNKMIHMHPVLHYIWYSFWHYKYFSELLPRLSGILTQVQWKHLVPCTTGGSMVMAHEARTNWGHYLEAITKHQGLISGLPMTY